MGAFSFGVYMARKRQPKAKPFQYNRSLERKYAARLKALVGNMTASARNELVKLLNRKGATSLSAISGISEDARKVLNKLDKQWGDKFNEIAGVLSPKMMAAVMKESKAASLLQLRALYEDKTLEIKERDTELVNTFKASVNYNVDLIRTIPEEYFKNIRGAVMRSIASGGTFADLKSEFERYDDYTIHRAENIALDQTRKAYSSFNREMCKQAGVKKAIWVHVDRTLNPRKKHKEFNGKEFDLSKGAPVGTMKGGNEYVMPAEEPYCNCTFIPILEFESNAK